MFFPAEQNQYYGKLLNSTDDLNSLSAFGQYAWTSSSVPANTPFTTGDVIVMRYATSGIQQVAFNSSQLYIRCYSVDNGWTSWIRVEKPYIKSVSFTNTNSVAIASNSSQDISLSTTESLTGFTLAGITGYNLYTGAAAIGLVCKSLAAGSIVIENLSSSSITIPASKVVVNAKYIRTT